MAYDAVVALALELPGTAESSHYGYLAVKRDKHFMFGLRHPEEEVACFQLTWDDHDRFLMEYPDVAYKIPHFEGYPAFLVRLKELETVVAQELVKASHDAAPHKAVTKPRNTL